jgi:hypothetical protein
MQPCSEQGGGSVSQYVSAPALLNPPGAGFQSLSRGAIVLRQHGHCKCSQVNFRICARV